jgi:hypothetical protein
MQTQERKKGWKGEKITEIYDVFQVDEGMQKKCWVEQLTQYTVKSDVITAISSHRN